MRDLIFLLVARVFIQGIASAIAPTLPFFATRESRDVLEYLTHSEMIRLHWFEGYVPFIYPITWFFTKLFPSASPLFVVKVLILLVDCVTAVIWYAIVEQMRVLGFLGVYRRKNQSMLSSSAFLTGMYLLNPFSIIYNEACNADGVKYFWVTLAIYAALKQYGHYGGGIQFYVLMQIAACGMLLNNSFKIAVVLMPLAYMITYSGMELERDACVSVRALRTILLNTMPHILLTVSIFLIYIVLGDVAKVQHILAMQFGGKGSGIDYSIYWYLHRVVPSVFLPGNLFKTNFMIFLLPLPLCVVLRFRPLEYLLTMLNIAILQQPRLSLLGVWFMVCVFSLHYPCMDKTMAFTKLMIIMFASMMVSVAAYLTWVGRYVANPNYLFAPQLIIFLIMCMIIEDYATAHFVWSTPKEDEEQKRLAEEERIRAERRCCCH